MITDTTLENATDDLERDLSRARQSLSNGLRDLIAEEEDAENEIEAFDQTVTQAIAAFRQKTGQSKAD